MCLGAFLNCAIGGRVVTLSLDHSFATVYDRRRVAATDPTDLVEAIRGPRPSKQRKARGPSQRWGASMADRPESGSKAIQTEATGPYSEAATDGQKKRPDGSSKSPRSCRRPS